MDYIEATEFLLALPDMERCSHGSAARTMSLDAMCSLLAKLGNPELGRQTVHVTGSKGKGSTSVFIASMLRAAAATSLYTSPHLHSFCERICLNLQPVSNRDFASGVAAIKEAVSELNSGPLGPISTFGAITSLFFYLSRQYRMQWQVVEVGMGGRHDATNVFTRKELVVITAISLEHTKMLGKTNLAIAENKAGIIRPDSVVVLAPQKDPAVEQLIERVTLEQAAKFISVARQYKIQEEAFDGQGQEFTLSSSGGRRSFSTKMLGKHQLDNAATAIAALDAMNGKFLQIGQTDLAEALSSVLVPGRLELLQRLPRVIVDGAHNGESAAALVAGLNRHFPSPGVIFVLGVNSDKNISEILQKIKPICTALIATRSQSLKAMDAETISAAAKKIGMNSSVIDTPQAAIERAMQLAGADGLVCATGSLYLVAEVREYFLGAAADWKLVGANPVTESTLPDRRVLGIGPHSENL